MNSFWIAFLTGITTGGLSCMVVQGGLITSSLAGEVEKSLARRKPAGPRPQSPPLALPILLFLAAKLAVYTLEGFLLGWLGSVLSLTPVMLGILQMAIAIFMLGNALRMLNVHPIFRYFSFEPPRAVTRLIRRKSRSPQADQFTTPILLGLLTVLIPCGVTQAMMAVAISTGSPTAGAATMFAFILGTTPVFFGLVYLATKLSSLLEKYFTRVVALALIILGIISLNSGLNLVGSPLSLDSIGQAAAEGWTALTGNPSQSEPAAGTVLSSDLRLDVQNNGYFPRKLYAPANQPVKLHLVTNNVSSCSRDFTIPSFGMEVLLDDTGEKVLDLPPLKSGTILPFSCSMGMYTGVIEYR